MELSDVISMRKSIRAFKPDPVSRENLETVINAGIAAPSKGNSQIWEFVAVTGDTKKALDRMLFDLLQTDFIPSMQLSDADDDEEPGEALKKVRARSSQNKEEISEILSRMDQTFDDFMLEGTFTFFNAPVAILVFADVVFAKDLPHVLSIGAAVQNMLLTATDINLGACWIGGVWRYTKKIRTLLKIPDNKILLSSVALGYPDSGLPITAYKSSRDDISEFVKWIGF